MKEAASKLVSHVDGVLESGRSGLLLLLFLGLLFSGLGLLGGV